MQHCEFTEIYLAGVSDNQLYIPAQYRLTNFRAKHWMLFGGIGANYQHGVGILGNILHRVCHRSRTQGCGKAGNGAGMAKARAVVDVVSADDLPGKLVHQVVFFVRAFSRGKHTDTVGPIGVARCGQFLGNQIQSRIPICLNPRTAVFFGRPRFTLE